MANSDSGIFTPSIGELGVEDLVPAVLGICLRKHHQFDIGGIAPELAESSHQIIDLIARQGEPPLGVGAGQRGVSVLAERHHAQRARRAGRETSPPDRACRPIAIRSCDRASSAPRSRSSASAERGRGVDEIHRPPLQAPHAVEPADMRDVGGLARPGRHGAQPRGRRGASGRAPPANAARGP